MTTNLFLSIIECVRYLCGSDYLYFDSELRVKKSPHSPKVSVWAVCVSPSNKVFLMDADEQWHEVENSEDNELILESLYQRVNLVMQNTLKQSRA